MLVIHHAYVVSGSQLIRLLAILHTNSHFFLYFLFFLIFFLSMLLYNAMNMYVLCASSVFVFTLGLHRPIVSEILSIKA